VQAACSECKSKGYRYRVKLMSCQASKRARTGFCTADVVAKDFPSRPFCPVRVEPRHSVGSKTVLILILYKLTSAPTRAHTLHSTTHTYSLC
jgi:hypothetical protein